MEKIGFYISSLTAGGAERVISNLANDFAQKGKTVYMITDSMEDKEYHKLEKNVERIILPKEESAYRVANAIKRVTNLRKVVRETEIESLISFIGKTNIRAILATRFMKVRVIVSVRSAPAREYGTKMRRSLAKILFHFASGIVFQTEEAKAFFSKAIQKKSIVLMNSIHPDFIRERYKGERGQEIVTVGRLDRVKNHELLIRAYARLVAEYPKVVLRIYGDGENRENLEQLISDMQLEKKVFLEGNCNTVAETIIKSKIFALSSDMEGMPNALLEAMSLGLAVVSTDCPCGGPRTVIRNGENGLLVPVNDVDAMEQAFRQILENPELEEMLGKNAAKLGEELAPDKVNRMWMEYIEQGMK